MTFIKEGYRRRDGEDIMRTMAKQDPRQRDRSGTYSIVGLGTPVKERCVSLIDGFVKCFLDRSE